MASYEERIAALRKGNASVTARLEAAAAPPDQRLTATAAQHAAAAEELEKWLASQRARAAAPDPALATARALAEQTLPRHEQLKELKNKSRDLESQLRQALSLKLHRESEYKLIMESISNAGATNEKLKASLTELQNMRDKYAAVLSDQLKGLEIREEKANEDAALREQFDAAISWFRDFLGLQIVRGEEGVKFVFDKIDPQRPEKQYSISLKIDGGTYKLVQCDLPIEDLEELVKDLNLTGEFRKFLKLVREKFKASSVNDVPSVLFLPPMTATVNRTSEDVPSVPFSPPVTATVNRRSEDVPSQSDSRSTNKSLPAKRRGTGTGTGTPGSARHSLRLEAKVRRQQEN